MTRENENITAAMLPAYHDGALPPAMMARVRDALERDAELRAAYETLLEQDALLYDLGAALHDATPSVDVSDAVMTRLRESHSENDAVETALYALGDALRETAPDVEMTAEVMAQLPATPNALSSVEKDLVETGEALRLLAPRTDVVAPVMSKVAERDVGGEQRFDAYARRKAARREDVLFSWRFVAAAAACVLAILGVLVIQLSQPPAPQHMHTAHRPQHQEPQQPAQPSAPPAALHEGEPLQFLPGPSDDRISLLTAATRPETTPEFDPTRHREDPEDGITAEDIIAARREALGGQSDALALLARWGALDPDEVRRLLDAGQLSPFELAGLSRFLPDDEARALLEQALQQSPDNASLRFALARNLMLDPASYDEALQQLAMLKRLAPDNSMPYYLDAQIRFAQGDYDGALEALSRAAVFQSGNAFALDYAQQHHAALHAAGMSEDAAQLLAAFNAGAEEYNAAMELSYDLLSYGAYFESMGDYESALAVYKNIHYLGLQLTQGATVSNELLAGLDVQMTAIQALDTLAAIIDLPGSAQTIEMAYAVFMEGLDFFLEYTNVFEYLLSGTNTQHILNIARYMMQHGDLAFPYGP